MKRESVLLKLINVGNFFSLSLSRLRLIAAE